MPPCRQKPTRSLPRLKRPYASVLLQALRSPEVVLTRWEQPGAEFMQYLWMIGREPHHLHNDTFRRCSDKRLSVEIASLRQLLWLAPDGSLKEKLSDCDQDMVRWIDTSTMVADCLTKHMDPQRLMQTTHSGILDLTPTDASILQKMKKQKGRATAANREQDTEK